MRAVLTVTGKDKKGIIAKVSAFLAERNINIEDISQTIMQDYFTMVIIMDISQSTLPMAKLAEESDALGQSIGMSVRIQHEDIFNAMHII